MSTTDVAIARCEALFVSLRQPSEVVSGDVIRHAIQQAVRAYGTRGCAELVAQEFGDHPDTAVARMRWARGVVAQIFPARSRAVATRPVGGMAGSLPRAA